jgi:hypothetical protein
LNACVKTGALVHMIPHNLVFSADLFEVAGAIVVRANGPIVHGRNAWDRCAPFCEEHQPTHELLDDHGSGFWREDLGVFVVPADLVRPCFARAKEVDRG